MRFTTYEVVETVPLVVIKKDSSREPFDRQKLLNAMVRACAKRPVSYESLERAVSSIEQTLLSSYDREIPSVRIGELTMQELKKIDEVAYVRFASVYRQFADVESFFNELKKLMGDRMHFRSKRKGNPDRAYYHQLRRTRKLVKIQRRRKPVGNRCFLSRCAAGRTSVYGT